ncbi:MAG: prepilin-type N-terminal cleavage/methylation domain-containing protein, partial [Planctomycetes bacterium]|nr:prepilin-type N-terminal cleavage/methylation domain-containing protein [Planctomycetota bacterium]
MAGTLNALPFSSVIPAQAGIQTTWGVASRLCRDVFDQPQKPLSAKTSRHRRDATKHRGFTLVELLVAIALLSVLGL